MEAAPRLPMISFELKTNTEVVSFGSRLKQYIASFYHEDPESYNNEIHNLDSLRSAATRPAVDVAGCQLLKKYYCQLHFLKSRFPMEKGQACAVSFSWKDLYAGLVCSVADIDYEISSILYNIGALHTQLGAMDARSSSEGMKMACTHFQCAAWAFQHLKENYSQLISLSLAPEVINFMYQLCLAQAQECILEKSMMDNRKATIIAKVAVQVVDYYNQALAILMMNDEGIVGEIVGSRVFKDWSRYLKFKVAYHSCVSLLYQGQQAEEAQKMGERVAYYQAASEQLEESRKLAKSNMGQQQHDVDEALGFTQDVVEGKRKAAKNENEFIYHEVVPERDALQQVNGASLVKGIPFSVNDPDVSGTDLFQRLVPMEAHEASSVYSEQKAEMLRQIGAIVDTKDSELLEFMSSLQLDCLDQWRQANGVPQEIVDRAAAICAKPQATQALIDSMNKLAGTCHEVESVLTEINELIKEEENKEQEYQKIMGTRPPSIVQTDLSREAGKYSEAHSKANESNQTLHRAMTMHMANLKILAQPISELKKAIPSSMPGDVSIDETVVQELKSLVAKVEEMRSQRATLVGQLREAVCADDITSLLVTKPADMSMDQLFQKELGKHKRQAALIEQNLAAQDNILTALTDIYARFAVTRRHIVDIVKKREATTTALIASYDAYDDLLAKANKGIEFYQKLEGNVSKLQQRVKSACRVNDEEREQMLAKSGQSAPSVPATTTTTTSGSTLKLKDYLAAGIKGTTATQQQIESTPQWVPPIRPAPLGSEETNDKRLPYDSHTGHYPQMQYPYQADYYPHSMGQSVPAASTATTVQQPTYNYSPSTGYYAYNSANVPGQDTATVAANSQQQNYQNYYGTQTTDQYQQPQSNVQNYQVPTNYYSSTDTKTSVSQSVPNYQNMYVAPTYSMAANYSSNTEPTYQTSAGFAADPKVAQHAQQNYSVSGAYYQQSQSIYTPPTLPNYQYPTIYSPNLDTSAPSQKQQPSNSYQSSYYPSTSTYSNQNYQQVPEQQTSVVASSANPVSSIYSGIYSNQNSGTYPSQQVPEQQAKDSSSTNIASGTYSSPYSNQNTGTYSSHTYQQVPEQQAKDSSSTNIASGTYSTAYPNQNNGTYSYQQVHGQQAKDSIATNLASGTYSSAYPNQMQQIQDSNSTYSGVYSNQNSAAYTGQTYQQIPAKDSSSINPVPGTYAGVYPNQNSGTYSSQTYQQISGQQTKDSNSTNPVSGTYSNTASGAYQTGQTDYTYPTNYNIVNNATSQQYVAPPSEYPTHSQYIPQYYPTSTYQQQTVVPLPNDINNTDQTDQDSQQTNYYSSPYGYQTSGMNPVTMMQANTNTDSSSKKTSVCASASNVDLLAGLDFSVNQVPLQPQVSDAIMSPSEQKEPNIAHQSTDSPGVSTKFDDAVKEEEEGKKEKSEVREIKEEIPPDVKDPLSDPETLASFSQEVDKLEKFVDGLTTKTLNGPTPLDIKWKEIQEQQERDAQKCSISVARCYPMKNRFADILPYDQSRVELPSTKDDYINASHVRGISAHAPAFIITQAPLKATFDDFWTMVWEQQIEVIVCLLGDSEIQQEGCVYWPIDRGVDLTVNKHRITLQSVTPRDHWIERIISLTDGTKHLTLIHLQFTSWPGSGLFPTTVVPLVNLAAATLQCYRQQRIRIRPVLVHCLSGVGRSGVLCTVLASMCDPIQFDVGASVGRMARFRKNTLRDREHLKFAYQAVVQHFRDLLNGKQLVQKIQNVTIEENSSRRSSASSEVSIDQLKQKKKFTPESFGVLKEQGIAPLNDTSDPLSALDPLWTMKK